MSFTIGILQLLRRFALAPPEASASATPKATGGSLLSQFTTTTRPVGNCRENVAPFTSYEPTLVGVLEVVARVAPEQFMLLVLP